MIGQSQFQHPIAEGKLLKMAVSLHKFNDHNLHLNDS
jgi:hypothetical protein